MATAVSICSNALLELGASPIADFNETGDRARLCANLYPATRDAVLRAHPWNCCIKRVQLAALATGPDYGPTTRYLLPADWLRTVRVGDTLDTYAADFRQEGRYLLTDGSAFLRYVARVDEGSWDPLLVEVATAAMKWKLAYPITKSTTLRETLGAEYQRTLQHAKSVDAQDEPGEQVADYSPLIAVRY